MEQTRYVRNIFIGTNGLIIEDIIDYCNRSNKTGLILFLNFEKAFDTVEWPFMIEKLKAFNFGKDWKETIYNKPTCVIKNNGYFLENIAITRGIRQVCTIYAMIFVLVVEILALRIFFF